MGRRLWKAKELGSLEAGRRKAHGAWRMAYGVKTEGEEGFRCQGVKGVETVRDRNGIQVNNALQLENKDRFQLADVRIETEGKIKADLRIIYSDSFTD